MWTVIMTRESLEESTPPSQRRTREKGEGKGGGRDRAMGKRAWEGLLNTSFIIFCDKNNFDKRICKHFLLKRN